AGHAASGARGCGSERVQRCRPDRGGGMGLIARIQALASRLDLPERAIVPVVALCLGFKRNGSWLPGWLFLGRTGADDSLFYNGVLFIRVMLPCFIGIGIRWSGSTSQRA